MKVAVVLYGQPRDYINGHRNIMNFCNSQKNVSFDFFYHCWVLHEGEEYTSYRTDINETQRPSKEYIQEQLIELYNPKYYEYEAQIIFDSSVYINTIAYKNTKESQRNNINNIVSQMYSKTKARNLLKEYMDTTHNDYDFVLMTRFDIRIMPNICVTELTRQNTYISDIHRPRKIMPDNCILTSTKTFLEWFNIYENIHTIVDNIALLQHVSSLGETIYFNGEEILFAKYILHYKDTNNIVFFKGGLI